MKADGTEQASITTDAYRDEYPALTPDGKTIVFRSNRVGGIYYTWRIGPETAM